MQLTRFIRVFGVAFPLMFASLAYAQPRGGGVVSPEVLADRRVTFRINAPKATDVSLTGEWLAASEKLTKDASGVWSVTLGPLDPGLSIYSFTVDGIAMADPVNPRIKLRASTSASLVNVPGDPPALWEARDVPHGRVEINPEKSTVIGDTRAYYVYTPPGYERGTDKYPVVYLLHGNNDTAAGWTDVGKANFIIDNLLAEKKVVPMLLVMPWGHATPYGQQGNNNALFERYLLEDVIPGVEKHYRVAADREHRAIVGLSMGGGQTLQIGWNHLDLFSAIGAFSFVTPAGFEARYRALLDDPAATNVRLPVMWLGCGRQDSMFTQNKNFAAMLTSHQINATFHETEGRHQYAVWRKLLAEIAPVLFRADSSAGDSPSKKLE